MGILASSQINEEYGFIFLTGTLALFIFIGLLVTFVIVSQRTLREKQKESFNLLLEAVEKESRRIGQDLHDDVGSLLSGVKLNLGSALNYIKNPEELIRMIELQQNMIANSIIAIREISHNLCPSSLNRYGLISEIEDRFSNIEDSKEWNMLFENKFYPENGNKAVETSIFRIINELIHNTIKHSNGDQVILNFTSKDKFLEITYEDNGTGFNFEFLGNGIGLSGVKARITLLNGHFELINSNNSFKAIIRIRLTGLV
jgi:signal transduction histidine kinase